MDATHRRQGGLRWAVTLLTAVGVVLGVIAIGWVALRKDAVSATPVSGSTSTLITPSEGASSTDGDAPRRLVAIGDSVVAGGNCQCETYPYLYGRAIVRRTGVALEVENRGENGATAASTALDVRDATPTRSALLDADIVLLTVGANDMYPLLTVKDTQGCGASCYVGAAREVMASIEQTVATVKQANTKAKVLVTTYWNLFPDRPLITDRGQLAWSDAVTRVFNDEMKKRLPAVGASVVDTYAPFKGTGSADPTPYLMPDGDHPSVRGHQVLGEALARATGYL